MPSFRRRVLAARRLRGWSLRGRLVVTLLSSLAVVSVSFGIVTQIAMSRQLTSQLDARLAAASSRSYGALGGPGPDGSPGGSKLPPSDASFLTTPGQPVGTLGARIVDGAVTQADTLTSATGTADGSTATATQAQTRPVAMPAADYPVLTALPPDGHARTRTLSTLGRYRLLAVTEADGDILVTGLPLADVSAAL
ncbi:MAG: two-component system, OmpR family, sensor kinase, partial [Actinomycetota bacterium]|nr:two-component system, OmpR family, sensor kinase [Actinomycetota bacterium]